jgi:hypothetical protein
MEPRPKFIQDLALTDPVAAYGMTLGIPQIPISMNCVAVFSSFSLSQPPIEGDLDTTIAQRTWIDNLSFSLLLPQEFSGNVFKPLYDASLKSQPGVSVRVSVHSGPRYLVSPQYTPLENFVNNYCASRWSAGWPLYKQQSIKTEFILTQAPPSTSPNGPPYTVTLTFNGWQFLDHTLDDMTGTEAANRLRAMGFWIPDPACLRK